MLYIDSTTSAIALIEPKVSSSTTMRSTTPAPRDSRAPSASPRLVSVPLRLRMSSSHDSSPSSGDRVEDSSTSSHTVTTYTSAAPSTRPTSMSSSSTACKSPKFHDVAEAQSAALHAVKYTLFGFEITVAWGVTKTPRLLPSIQDGRRPSTVTATASDGKVAYELSFGERAIVVVAGLFFAQWLAVSATQNIFTFVAVFGSLWLIFGGHSHLEHHVLGVARSNEGVSIEGDKVSEWLRTLRHGSNEEMSLSATSVVFKTEDTVLDVDRTSTEEGQDAVIAGLSTLPDLFVDYIDHVEVLAWMNKLPDNYDILSGEEQEAIFTELCQLPGLFTDYTDHIEILAWMNKLPGVFTISLAEEDIDDNSASGAPGANIEASIPDWLAFLLQQHESPTFNDGDLRLTALGFDDFINPIFVADETASCSNWTGVPTDPGRPVKADAADIYFMYNKLEHRQYLPSWLINEAPKRTADEWYKLRSHEGHNFLLEELSFLWNKAVKGPGAVNTIEDVHKLVKESRQMYTAECPVSMRTVCGVGADYRAYLTDAEVMVMDEGCLDFRYEQREEISKVLSFLRVSKQFAKIKPHNPILAWVQGIDEDDVLDAFAFGDCDCGVAAMGALADYRNENERNYSPEVMTSWKEFLLQIGGNDDRYTNDDVEDGRLPRCQKILQPCKQHETCTDNIYILVDTSYEDINNRLSNPGGPLPVPQSDNHTKYPPGWRVVMGHAGMPYEAHAPRCVHGLLHAHCGACFPRGHLWTCAECQEYRNSVPVAHANIVQIERAINAANAAGTVEQDEMDTGLSLFDM